MAKSKRKQPVATAPDKNNTLDGLMDSSITGARGDLHEDDGWMIVKKQRIIILVPPLSAPVESAPQSLRRNQVQVEPKNTVKSRSVIPIEKCPRKCSEVGRNKSFALASKEKFQMDRVIIAPQPDPTKEKLQRPATGTLSLFVGESLLKPPSLDPICDKYVLGAHRSPETDGLPLVSEVIKQPSLPLYIRHNSVRCLYGSSLQNQRMRATNLERKLERAGGLSRWLVSLGLEQFIQIFQRKNVTKFQLVNLTMSKLKDMGADAVGPRRKLIHAINCLCPQYHFKALKMC